MRKPIAYRGAAPFTFVAYSHSDADRVYEELNWLNQKGFNAYYDDGIYPGHQWRQDIADAIDNSAVFIFYLTTSSIASEDCLRELNYALTQQKPILAIHLEETELPSGVKLAISDRQAILAYDMNPDDYRSRLKSALEEFLPDAKRQSAAKNHAPVKAAPKHKNKQPWAWYAAATVFLLVLLAIGSWLVSASLEEPKPDSANHLTRADSLELLRKAEALANDDRYGQAYLLIRSIGSVLDEHPDMQRLKADVLQTAHPQIRNEGAQAFFRPMEIGLETEWIPLGTTPVEPFEAPRGVLEMRIEKNGFRTGHFVLANPGPLLGNFQREIWFESFPETRLPLLELAGNSQIKRDFVHIPGASMPVILQGAPQQSQGGPVLNFPAYAIGRAEVTNREFKDFVDAGGYLNSAYWSDLKFEDGTPFVLEQYLDEMADTTGRPAPAGWELGNYSAGAADLPVGGLSWFEAMAYARFRNMSLPTAHHWARAAQGPGEAAYATVPIVAHLGNYNSGALRHASEKALGPWGTYDMAGNVREWVTNATSQGRLAMGGSWNDYASNYFQAYSIRPMNRSLDNGLRLMAGTETPDDTLQASIELLIDSPRAFREPMTAEAFDGMRAMFGADHEPPLNVTVEVLEETVERRIEEITLHFSSGEPFTLYIAFPKPLSKPAQSVVYMPSGAAFLAGKTPNRWATWHFDQELDFINRSGRVTIVPIWDGSRDRYRNFLTDGNQSKAAISWYRDIIRTIDYVVKREVLARDKIAFMGFSYGALFGPVILALEDRLQTGVLISGGIYNTSDLHASLDLTNYAQRIPQPILLVNGKYDPIVPYGLSQQRLLKLLPNPENEQVLFDELGHWGFPRHRFYRTVVDWLDAQLGPVR